MQDQIRELEQLAGRACRIEYSDMTPEEKYDMIFSPSLSRRVYALFREIGLSFDYYDPDTTYEEDVAAFVSALNWRVGEIKQLGDIW